MIILAKIQFQIAVLYYFFTQTQWYMFIPRYSRNFSHKTWQKYLKSHYASHFCILRAYPKQPNALAGSTTSAISQGEMACIALPNVAGRAF